MWQDLVQHIREESHYTVKEFAACQAFSAVLNFPSPLHSRLHRSIYESPHRANGEAKHVLPSKAERMAILRQVLPGVFGAPC